MIRLVLGGEKSGKSAHAWELFREAPGEGVVMAMGLARDQAFRRQILAHRLERGPGHPVIEPGERLPQALAGELARGRNVLVDSLDFWLFACMERGIEDSGAARALYDALDGFNSPGAPDAVLVTCEVGLGPIAATSLARRFARAQGALNQGLAALAGEVRLVVAGLPIVLK